MSPALGSPTSPDSEKGQSSRSSPLTPHLGVCSPQVPMNPLMDLAFGVFSDTPKYHSSDKVEETN